MTTLFNKRPRDEIIAQNNNTTQEMCKLSRNDTCEFGEIITSAYAENDNIHKDDNNGNIPRVEKELDSVDRGIETTDEEFEGIEKEPKHELHNVLSYAIDDFHSKMNS